MIGWLKLTEEQRKAVIDEAEQLSGINAKAIEKDWWVTLTLKALFQSKYCEFIVFKGGTSLSKSWNLIARFSEDIDIALDPRAFGMEYKDEPTKSYVDKLKKSGCKFTSTELLAELKEQFKLLGIPESMVAIEATPVPDDRPDTDPQTLLVKYPSLYESNSYISEVVKIEVSVRSLRVPFTTVEVQSILNAVNPKDIYGEKPFPLEVVEAKKTFLEKIFLLHEEFSKPDKTKISTKRMSRHLYDIYKIMNSDVAKVALADHDLYAHLIAHRRGYTRYSWFDYNTLEHSTVSFIPPPDIIGDYRRDYEVMEEQMIYEKAVPFADLIAALKLLQARVRLKHAAHPLEEVLEIAKKKLLESADFDKQEGRIYTTEVIFFSQDSFMKTKSISYSVSLLYNNAQFFLETITVR
jgi:hypothetical protein